jgi:hypothetical protein
MAADAQIRPRSATGARVLPLLARQGLHRNGGLVNRTPETATGERKIGGNEKARQLNEPAGL